jgi:putative redox protein
MIKTATARHETQLRFVVRTGSGHDLVVDDALGDAGSRPAELLLAAQAGCTGMDVASILAKKRQAFDSYRVTVQGEQRDDPHPHVFTRIDIVHELTGSDIEVEAVRRAIELSATRYCTATAMLSAGPAKVRHSYRIRRGDGRADEAAEVCVTGPQADPDALSALPAAATAT